MPRSTALPIVVATLVLAVAAHPLSAQQTLYESPAATAQVAGVELPMVVDTYDRDGDRQRTWLYVFEKDGQLVKHRATTPEADVEVIAPRVEAFVAETLGELDAAAATAEPDGLLWEQEHGPMRIADLHLPLVADGFAALEVERDIRRPRLFRVSYRSQSRTAPVLNVVAHARRDTSLVRVFAQAYGPLRMGAEQRGMEFEEDELLVCEWRVPGDETVTGFSGGVRLQGANDTRYAQVIATNADPWSVVFTIAHPPGQEVERRYPPILSEILARITSEGTGGRIDIEPELRAAPEGVIG